MSQKEEAEWPPIEEAAALIEQRLGYRFKDVHWLERALTHRSLQRTGDEKSHYERLEFIGDAVLDLAVGHLLLDQYPAAREGALSKMRAALVNTTSLADLARSLGIKAYIRLSKGEVSRGGAEKCSILADVMEALIGAIYRESGFEPAFQCTRRLFDAEIPLVNPSDPKTELQELLHARALPAPVYRLLRVEGPEHEPTFVSEVEVDGGVLGLGSGGTKKASQQAAALRALDVLCAERKRPGDSTTVSESSSAEGIRVEE